MVRRPRTRPLQKTVAAMLPALKSAAQLLHELFMQLGIRDCVAIIARLPFQAGSKLVWPLDGICIIDSSG